MTVINYLVRVIRDLLDEWVREKLADHRPLLVILYETSEDNESRLDKARVEMETKKEMFGAGRMGFGKNKTFFSASHVCVQTGFAAQGDAGLCGVMRSVRRAHA